VENPRTSIIDLSSFNPEDYPVEDYEERARQERAREMAEGVDPPPGFRPGSISFCDSNKYYLRNNQVAENRLLFLMLNSYPLFSL